MTRSEATKSTAAEQLVDIRDVKIDRSLPSEERIKSFMKMNKDSSLSIEFNHMDEFKAIYDTIDILRKEVA